MWLLSDRMRHRADDGARTEQPVAPDDWERTLREHFDLTVPAPDEHDGTLTTDVR